MTPPTQPIDGTLLAAFQRFADLSCYWHRAHTPDSLAIQELQERQRLLVDIPELIKRNTAFADLVSTRMFDAVAKVHAEPPRDDAGQGWRMLEDGEELQLGDEIKRRGYEVWYPVEASVGSIVDNSGIWDFRRRIAKEPPQDTAGHIRADFEPSLAESLRKCTGAVEVTVTDGTRQETAKACDLRRVTPPSAATKAATEPPNWREVVARVHRYMSGDQTYDHGCMTEDSGPNCVTSSKLIAELLGEQP